MPKNGHFWREVLKVAWKMVKQCYHTGKLLGDQKLVENAKSEKLKCDTVEDFTIVLLPV